ncbi:hypothetical protein [Burkholderia cenocepacia]|uniref:hypothetical protein n=1 Tax=Burkholderia cenocepacia TaxID=95486 RepID=UPI002AB7AFB9|nr:hypothetical protein [Burkholderia cenocepacia]
MANTGENTSGATTPAVAAIKQHVLEQHAQDRGRIRQFDRDELAGQISLRGQTRHWHCGAAQARAHRPKLALQSHLDIAMADGRIDNCTGQISQFPGLQFKAVVQSTDFLFCSPHARLQHRAFVGRQRTLLIRIVSLLGAFHAFTSSRP